MFFPSNLEVWTLVEYTTHDSTSFTQQTNNDNTAKMNIGKRFDRMKQWTDERMGKEIKTAASDEFKALELEMQLRHEGMLASTVRGLSSQY